MLHLRQKSHGAAAPGLRRLRNGRRAGVARRSPIAQPAPGSARPARPARPGDLALADLFFVLSKLFWGLARPDALLLLLLGAGVLALWLGRPRLGRALATVSLASFAALGLLPVDTPLLAPLEARWPPEPRMAGPAAGVIVLGGAEDVGAFMRWGVPAANDAGERFIAAIALAYRHPQARLLLSGGSGALVGAPDAPAESRLAERFLRDAGVDPARILREERSRNTTENAVFSLALVRAEGLPEAGPWLLVTSAFHMTRAVETFCAAGWRGIVPWPVDFRTGAEGGWPRWALADRLDRLNFAIKERIGLLVYRLTGRATPPEAAAGCLAPPG